jgi:hypothetical protein
MASTLGLATPRSNLASHTSNDGGWLEIEDVSHQGWTARVAAFRGCRLSMGVSLGSALQPGGGECKVERCVCVCVCERERGGGQKESGGKEGMNG